MRLALYQPDIPQNVGSLLRLSACFGIPTDIIEPCGFPLDDRKLKRAGMDYIPHVALARHPSWDAFKSWHKNLTPSPRLVLLTTKVTDPYVDFSFRQDDILVLGRESAGVPEEVHHYADAAITIPMIKPMRSLNVVVAAAIVLAEALRQTGQLPDV